MADYQIIRANHPDYERLRKQGCNLCGGRIDLGYSVLLVTGGYVFHCRCADLAGMMKPKPGKMLERMNYRF
jgi:hypothetical protein